MDAISDTDPTVSPSAADGKTDSPNGQNGKLVEHKHDSPETLSSTSRPVKRDDSVLPVIRHDSTGLAEALEKLGYAHRWNVRHHRFEVRHNSDDDYQELNDRLEAALRELISERFQFLVKVKGKDNTKLVPARFSRASLQDAMNVLAYHNPVDPFIEYLDALPSWDGKPRLNTWLSAAFVVDDNDHELVWWASRHLFLAPVYRAFEPGYPLHETIVLVGPQGCGKSSVLQAMLPPEGRMAWFDDGLQLADDRKRFAEHLAGPVIVEAAEMAGANRAELTLLKAALSRSNDRVRFAYERHVEDRPRRCILVGTTNDVGSLPNDPSGNRRFVPVNVAAPKGCGDVAREFMDLTLDKTDMESLVPMRTWLWAEALHLYRLQQRGGMLDQPVRLPAELRDRQREANEDHRREDEVIEDALAEWLPNAPVEFSLREAAVRVGLADNEQAASKISMRDSHRLGSALRHLGYVKVRSQLRHDRRMVWTSNGATL